MLFTITDNKAQTFSITVDFPYNNAESIELCTAIRKFANAHYPNWMYIDFRVYGEKYNLTVINDKDRSVIYHCNTFGRSKEYFYYNDGRNKRSHH